MSIVDWYLLGITILSSRNTRLPLNDSLSFTFQNEFNDGSNKSFVLGNPDITLESSDRYDGSSAAALSSSIILRSDVSSSAYNLASSATFVVLGLVVLS